MYAIKDDLRRELDEIEDAGLTKTERLITTPQSAHIATEAGEALVRLARQLEVIIGEIQPLGHHQIRRRHHLALPRAIDHPTPGPDRPLRLPRHIPWLIPGKIHLQMRLRLQRHTAHKSTQNRNSNPSKKGKHNP